MDVRHCDCAGCPHAVRNNCICHWKTVIVAVIENHRDIVIEFDMTAGSVNDSACM